jgi:MFS family permease
MLIGGRFAQGVGEALAAPAALSLVALLFTDQRERAKAFGIWGGIAGLGAVFGLLLSGVLTDLATWRWVFLINVPVAIVPLVLVPRLIRGGRSPEIDRRTDVVGAALVTGGMLAVVYGLLQAGQYGWPRLTTLAPLIGGLVALGTFLWWESRTAAPLVPMRFFANRTRVAANVCTILVAGSMMAMFFLVVLYMQDILGFGPLRAGLAYMPFMVTFTVGLGLSTNLVPRVGARNTIVFGLVAAAVGMFLLTRIEADGSYLTQLMPATLVLGFGLGLVNPAMANAALHRVSELDAGLASGVQTTVMQVGSATGVSILAALAAQHTAGLTATGTAAADATVAGYMFSFLIAGVILVIGAVAMLLVMERVTVVSAKPGEPLPVSTG